MNDLPTTSTPTLPAELLDRVRDYASASRSASTVRTYQSAWRRFETWCSEAGLDPLPADPETVALYLADKAGTLKVSTLAKHLVAIGQVHKLAGLESPTSDERVRIVMRGIRREHGVAQEGKAPVLVQDLRRMVDALPDGLIGVRDRALLLLGFAGGFRRSELVGLAVGDLAFREEGLVVMLRRSKTDQEGEGRQVGIPYGSRIQTCPVRAMRSWLAEAEIKEGPVFRAVDRHGNLGGGRLSCKAVALVVKRAASRVGLDASEFAGHSLRAGLATSAAAAGVPERVIARQTGHRSMAVLRRYIREGDIFRENAASMVGL